MIETLAQADAVFLMSLWKPIVMAIVLVAWAWIISQLDKDAEFYYLQRFWWNAAQMLCGVIGFGLMLLIPIFLLGLVVGLIVLGGGVLGYAYYRNTKVPEKARWSLSLDSFTHKLDEMREASAQKRASLAFLRKDDSRLEVPSGDNPDVAAHATLESVMEFALPRRADRVDLLMDSRQARLTARIDGVKYPQGDLEPAAAMRLIDYLKTAAGMDVADHRKKQVGKLKFDAGELGRHTLDITTSGSTRGVTMTMQLDAGERLQMPLTHLGLLDGQKQQILSLVQSPGKVVLVSAPAHHGGRTTLYSLLNEHDPYTSSVMTLEEGVVLELEGVNHNYLPEGTLAPQFNEKMAALLRGDPQVLLLTRIADSQTATMMAKGCEEVRLYAPFGEADTFGTLKAWVKLVGHPRLAATGIGAIISQRLIRRVCMTCRTAYKPDPAAVKKMNLPAERVTQLYRASGKVMVKDRPQPCPDCMGLGYRGRIGVFEVMILDDAARKLVATGDYDGLRGHLRKQKMLWLQEAALAKVVEGETDIREVTRTLAEKSDPRKESGQTKAVKS
jgi:type II secretory ATPase GspE/PulE/Tfp pilus assembly ATPase PilB-like protein